MIHALPVFVVAALGAVPASGQDQAMMPGMTMPAEKPPAGARPASRRPAARGASRTTPFRHIPPPAAQPHAGHAAAATRVGARPAADPHAGHDMSAMPGMSRAPGASAGDPGGGDMGGMAGMHMAPGQTMPHALPSMPGMASAPAGTDRTPGNVPAPAPTADHLADRFWGGPAMAASRKNDLLREHGGMTFSQIFFNLAEYQVRHGRDGYRWDGAAWIGGDINRLTVKSEGAGSFGKPLDQAEVQALYSRALDPYWNLQAGVRYDFKPNPSRTYATVGIEGLAPYRFDVEAALFVSDKGEMLARAEGYYDQLITNSLILQPRVEANFSAQDVPATRTGSGLTDLEAGLRLRYARRREFAPYVGVSWQRQFGETARFSRARGDGTGGFSFVAGARTWF